MIKANDLRIGNKVFLNTEEGKRIITVSYHEISYAARHSENRYEPIPLTIEILENNFGFIAKKGSGNLFDYNFYVKNGFTLAVKMHGFASGYIEFGSIVQLGGEYNCNGERFDRVRYVSSVHHLQNIYYSHKNGEELTFNTPESVTQS